ncbi:MAG: tRNA glutamyl-Q(34) synthetase GluQRS [Mariprofundus sp.]|nr:tRNA glutamyl-Q(34) synthetase GluQRS [Mariprofundus sp.]
MKFVTRFAPSPTGLLHVGNAYSALQCARWAARNHADLLLRIEDIDHTRCQSHFSDAILEDLNWLGIGWNQPVRKQSEHLALYQQALNTLQSRGMIYPCFCTRKAILNERSRMGVAPHQSDSATHYPGTCRNITTLEQKRRMQHEPFAWRLNIAKAVKSCQSAPSYHDQNGAIYQTALAHDIIIGRKDIGYSYHLAVVMDDALQGVTHVIRGEDLHSSSAIHRLLQMLLDLPEPIYIHHHLLKNSDGERLAKRIDSTTLRSLRYMGVDAAQLRNYLLDQSHNAIWPFVVGDEAAIVAKLAI